MENMYHPGYRRRTDIIVPPLLRKIPQAPSKTSCGNEDGQCSHRKVIWAVFADRSQPKVNLVFVFPQERSALPHSRPNNVIKTDGGASVPDTLIREMLVNVGKKGGAICERLQSSRASAPVHFISLHFPFSCLLQGPQGSSSSHFHCLFVSDLHSFHPCWAETQGGFGKQYFLFIY